MPVKKETNTLSKKQYNDLLKREKKILNSPRLDLFDNQGNIFSITYSYFDSEISCETFLEVKSLNKLWVELFKQAKECYDITESSLFAVLCTIYQKEIDEHLEIVKRNRRAFYHSLSKNEIDAIQIKNAYHDDDGNLPYEEYFKYLNRKAESEKIDSSELVAAELLLRKAGYTISSP